MWTFPIPTKRNGEKFRRKILDLEAALDAKDRTIKILQSEVESLAGVLARDRARVAAETAELSRRRAEAEGKAIA